MPCNSPAAIAIGLIGRFLHRPGGRPEPPGGMALECEPVEIDVELDIRADFTARVVIARRLAPAGACLMAASAVHVA